MSGRTPLSIDVVIFGGGGAGLWLLDRLIRAGRTAVVLEAGELGRGQTVSSQGIIHGGFKYSLGGLLTPAARAIRQMPLIWRRCLAGERAPDLRNTRLRAEFCHIWRTDSIRGRVAMWGARLGLQVAPRPLDRSAWPPVLAGVRGGVARLDEQVVEPGSFLADLADQHRGRLLRIDRDHGLEFQVDGPGRIRTIRLINPASGEPLDIAARTTVFTAGGGNQELRRLAGLENSTMQRRPLHMVLARGPLPRLNGHCVDGGSTRLTITSTSDSAERTIWQVGGRLAEEGVELTEAQLIDHAREEIAQTLPGLDDGGVDWATYRVDRAEPRTASGRRPDQAWVERTGNTITAWPTKMALVPQLADEVMAKIEPTAGAPGAPAEDALAPLAGWPRAIVALPPWEMVPAW